MTSNLFRPLLALGLVIVTLGMVQAYVSFRDSIPQKKRTRIIAAPANGKFDLEVTITFDASVDAFTQQQALVISRGETILFEADRPLKRGEQILIEDIPGITNGANEFRVEAFPTLSNEVENSDDGFGGFELENENEPVKEPFVQPANALRLRIIRDEVELGDTTIWSEPGEPISGIVTVEVNDINVEAAKEDESGGENDD